MKIEIMNKQPKKPKKRLKRKRENKIEMRREQAMLILQTRIHLE